MPVADLVFETSVTTGTGDFTLSGLTAWRRFNDAFGTSGADVFKYFIRHKALGEWEIGTGHLSDVNTLVRDTVIASSNADAKVDFSAGDKDVVNDLNADDLLLSGGKSGGQVLTGGAATDDNLTLAAHSGAFAPTDTGRIKFTERMAFTEDFSVAAAFVDALIKAEFDLTSGTALTNLTGFDFLPTLKPGVGQILSSAQAFWARPVIQHTAGVTDIITYYSGFVSQPKINPDVSTGSVNTGTLTAYTASPRVSRTGTISATVANVDAFASFNTPFIGVTDIEHTTVTSLSHLRAVQPIVGSGGTVINHYGINIDNLRGATTLNVGINCVMTAAATKYFIRHTGTAQSLFGGDVEIDGDLNHDGNNVGFYGTAPIAKPSVTGSRSGNAALASLLTQLANLGLITDSTT